MSGVRWRCAGQFRSVENGYEDECWTRLARRWNVATRGAAWDGGLDLKGLDAVSARQPKKCNSAPSIFSASSVKSRRAAGGDEPRVGLRERALRRGHRRFPRRADRSSALRPFVRSSSDGRHVKRRRGAAGQILHKFGFVIGALFFYAWRGTPRKIFFREQRRRSAPTGRWRGHDNRRTDFTCKPDWPTSRFLLGYAIRAAGGRSRGSRLSSRHVR